MSKPISFSNGQLVNNMAPIVKECPNSHTIPLQPGCAEEAPRSIH